jgi:hypothetical protein
MVTVKESALTRHFIHTNGNWLPSDKDSLGDHSEKVDCIATVVVDGRKYLILVEELKAGPSGDKEWLTPAKYPDGFFAEDLEVSLSKFGCRLRIRPESRDSKQQVSKNVDAMIKKNGNQYDLVSQELASRDLRIDDRSRAQIYYSLRGLKDNSESIECFIWTNFSQRNKPLLQNAVRFFNSHIITLINQRIELHWRPMAVESLEDEIEWDENIRDSISNERNIENSYFEAVHSSSSLDESCLVETDGSSVNSQITETKSEKSDELNQINTNKLQKSNSRFIQFVYNKCRIISDYGPFSLFLLVFIWCLFGIRTSEDVNFDHLSFQVQYLVFGVAIVGTFLSLLSSRVVLLLIQTLGLKYLPVGVTSRNRPEISSSNDARVVNRLRRILEGTVLSFLVYLLASIITWDTISDDTHVWLWSDRQTIGLVITMLIGVISALFSNALRDLSNKKAAILDVAQQRIDQSRYLLNEIHELADRLWSEYEQLYKNYGKIFVFRANQFSKQSDAKSNAFQAIARRLQDHLERIDGSKLGEESHTQVLKHLEAEFSEDGFDWADAGIQFGISSESTTKWEDYFQASDVSSISPTSLSNVSCAALIENRPRLYENFQNGTPISGVPPNGTLVLNEKQDYAEVLYEISKTFLAEDDGRFAVAPVSEIQKRILEAVRTINAMVVEVPIGNRTISAWGYFPTDEKVTIWFIEAIRSSNHWPDFDQWMDNIYVESEEFARRNSDRLQRLKDLTKEFEELVSSDGIPSGLLLDDVHLLPMLLGTGSDVFDDEGSKNEKRKERDLTLSRILTYASVYYEVVVWGRGPDRALLPTFPNPFPRATDDVEVKRTRHATERFTSLRRKMYQSLGQGLDGEAHELDAKRRIILEISNRQGPLLNWMRAARAYSRREQFLYRNIKPSTSFSWLDSSPSSRQILLDSLFQNFELPNGKFVAQQETLSEPIGLPGFNGLLRGPRSLKVRRKSSLSNSSNSWEGHDD